jgi:hypothetical protein
MSGNETKTKTGTGIETDLRKPEKVEYRTFQLAVLMKWKEGQQKYGPIFQGNPLAHMYEEWCDGANYITVGQEMGIITRKEADEMMDLVWRLATMTRNLYSRHKHYGGGDGGE